MYVCNCNGISQRQLRLAIKSGVRTWEAAHEYCGCRPSCGRCEVEITAAIQYEVDAQKYSECKTSSSEPALAGVT